MKVKIKKLHPKAVTPSYAKEGDAAMDLYAVSKDFDKYGNVVYGTKLAFEIPKGHVGLLFPRSSVSKTDLTLANSVGVVDSGYRGEVIFKFKQKDKMYSADVVDYGIADRVGQIMIIPIPQIELEVVDVLADSDRGEGGFGSTGS